MRIFSRLSDWLTSLLKSDDHARIHGDSRTSVAVPSFEDDPELHSAVRSEKLTEVIPEAPPPEGEARRGVFANGVAAFKSWISGRSPRERSLIKESQRSQAFVDAVVKNAAARKAAGATSTSSNFCENIRSAIPRRPRNHAEAVAEHARLDAEHTRLAAEVANRISDRNALDGWCAALSAGTGDINTPPNFKTPEATSLAAAMRNAVASNLAKAGIPVANLGPVEACPAPVGNEQTERAARAYVSAEMMKATAAANPNEPFNIF